jgi:hypothetical protein
VGLLFSVVLALQNKFSGALELPIESLPEAGSRKGHQVKQRTKSETKLQLQKKMLGGLCAPHRDAAIGSRGADFV